MARTKKQSNLGWDADGLPISLPSAALDALAWLNKLRFESTLHLNSTALEKLDASVDALVKQLESYFPTPLQCARGRCECHKEAA